MWCVYILHGSRYYIGSTNDLERRMKQHRSGHTYSTQRIGDRKLVGYIPVADMKQARALEREIKKSCHPERYLSQCIQD